MRTALRKMGNSTGMIVPKAILTELGAHVGATFEISVEDGRMIASPVNDEPRTGWVEAARIIGADEETADDWLGFANDGDDTLAW